jgi:hypothetical protein
MAESVLTQPIPCEWLKGPGDVPMAYFASRLAHTLEITRENGEELYMIVDHSKALAPPTTLSVIYVSDDPSVPVEHGTETLCGSDDLTLTLMSNDPEPIERQKITLSLQEARLLRDLLNRKEVSAVLDQEVPVAAV